MRKRGFILMTVCILIVGMLAGCGAGNGQDESQTQSNTGAASENESSAATTEEDSAEASSEAETDGDGTEGKNLVVYFSATGNTERVAEVIAETTGGELFELEPVDPYTDEDLNYNDDNSRVSQEYADESLRNVELAADTVDDWQDVERVYIGYPKLEQGFARVQSVQRLKNEVENYAIHKQKDILCIAMIQIKKE